VGDIFVPVSHTASETYCIIARLVRAIVVLLCNHRNGALHSGWAVCLLNARQLDASRGVSPEAPKATATATIAVKFFYHSTAISSASSGAFVGKLQFSLTSEALRSQAYHTQEGRRACFDQGSSRVLQQTTHKQTKDKEHKQG